MEQFCRLVQGTQGGGNPIKGEARAARLACLVAADFEGIQICIEGDCLELVNQVVYVEGQPVWEIAGKVETIKNLLVDHAEWSFSWTPREGNFAAHNLAHWCKHQNISGIIHVAVLPESQQVATVGLL